MNWSQLVSCLDWQNDWTFRHFVRSEFSGGTFYCNKNRRASLNKTDKNTFDAINYFKVAKLHYTLRSTWQTRSKSIMQHLCTIEIPFLWFFSAWWISSTKKFTIGSGDGKFSPWSNPVIIIIDPFEAFNSQPRSWQRKKTEKQRQADPLNDSTFGKVKQHITMAQITVTNSAFLITKSCLTIS